jgi:hypothetical protein
LIPITRRLVTIRSRLIPVTPGLVVIDEGARPKLNTTSRTPWNGTYLAAGSTPHNFCHHLSPFESVCRSHILAGLDL